MATELPPLISDNTVTLSFTFVHGGTTYAQHAYYGYCTVADAEFEFSNVRGMPTLTASVVAQEIAYAAQELQEALDYSYEMPYGGTDQNILGKLREMNAKLAASRIVERYYTGNAPNQSAHAERLKGWVQDQVVAIEKGLVRWAAPYGDAVARATLPVPSKSAIYFGLPDGTQGLDTDQPLFTINGVPRFRRRDSW